MTTAALNLPENHKQPQRRMRRFQIALLASPAATLLACIFMLASAASADTVSIHGSTTVIYNIIVPHRTEIEVDSGQQLEIVGNGSQRGIADLLRGNAQIAMISAPFDVEIEKFSEIQPGAVGSAHLNAYPVGELRVAFVVHPSNGVRSLSDSQLADLLTGKITSWSELGGSDQAVAVVAARPGDGVRTTVESTLLKGATLSADARAMANITQVPKVVAQLPNALGVIALSGVDDSVVELTGMSVIRLPLSLVVIGEPTPSVRRVIDAIDRVGRSQSQ